MLVKQFYEELAKLPGLGFECHSLHAIRIYRGSKCYCPLTAVANAVLGAEYTLSEMIEAGCALGLSREDSRSIWMAADGNKSYLDLCHSEVTDLRPLRQCMEKALGVA